MSALWSYAGALHVPLTVMLGVSICLFAGAGEVSAQSERFVRATADFRAAAEGLYGDEGRELNQHLEEMRAGLSSWTGAARDSEAALRESLQQVSGEESARAHLLLGFSYLRRNRYAEALDVFEAGAAASPNHPTLHLFRGLVLETLGRPDEAGAAFEHASELEPDDPVLAYLMLAGGSARADTGRARDVLDRLEQSVTEGATPRAAVPFVDLSVFADGPDADPVFVPERYAEGFARLARGEHERGIARLAEAAAGDPLVVDPASAREPMREAGAALRRRDVPAALAALERTLQETPDSSEAHRLLALVHGLSGNLQQSAQPVEAALRLRPDDERTWLTAARLHLWSGDEDGAMQTLDEATRAVPESGELQWMLGSLAQRLERTGEALAAYEAAARATAIAGRGELLRRVALLATHHQDLQRAVEAAQARVRLDRNNPAAHRALAALHTSEGRHDEAMAEFAVAAWLDPDHAQTFVALGNTHLALGREDRAVAALERAVMLEPTLREARYGLAQALIRAGRDAESREHLSEFQRLSTRVMDQQRVSWQINTLRRTARLHAADGRPALAAQSLEDALALRPGTAADYLELARALDDAGRLQESVDALVKAAELDGRAEVHLRLADVLARLGRRAESAQALETYQWLRFEDMERRRR